MKPISTPRGRSFVVLGDAGVVTMDRLTLISDRFDSDPRIASISAVFHPDPGQDFLRAAAPTGCAVAVATDAFDVTGSLNPEAAPEELLAWAREASDRGLWHDWWLTSARDVEKSEVILPVSSIDSHEMSDPASSRYRATSTARMDPNSIAVTIDATWLGPHQTGAQVLTTAAIEGLARSPRIQRIRLIGITELPAYAAHLAVLDGLEISDRDDDAHDQQATDVIWYPNQIDQRVNITRARSLGRRVITTYLDLIAYDIPRYHASQDAWAAYRTLQRRIALSVDGITTISADVAQRLQEEVPRLDPRRIHPIPLGLDHITRSEGEPDGETAALIPQLQARPFILVLGNDFQHKNRDFAIRVWEKVLADGVSCDLVLAGLHVKSSSSRDQEEVLLAQHTSLRGAAHTLGHVSEQSREWLLTNAAAVLYPSSAEGFGFLPYEAAALGTPSTFAAFGPLAEISQLSDVPRTWSVDAFAADLRSLLGDSKHAEQRVKGLRAAIGRSTWSQFAEQLLDFFIEIDTLPPVEASLVGNTAADASALSAVLSSKTWRATEPLRRLGSRMKRS